MSVSPLIVAVLATTFGLGELGERPDDSEMDEWKQRQIDNWEIMRLGVWEEVGLCKEADLSSRDCGYEDETPECIKAKSRNKPCEFNWDNIMRAMSRSRDEKPGWRADWPESYCSETDRARSRRRWRSLAWCSDRR